MRRWGPRRIYVCSQPDRVYVRLRIGLLSAPLPAIAAASRRALFFLLLYLPTLGARMGLLGSLAPLRTLDFGFAAGFDALLLGVGLASFFLKGATTPSGKSLARFGFALKSRFSECLGRPSDLLRSGRCSFGASPSGWKFDFRRGSSPFERPRGRSGFRLRSAGGDVWCLAQLLDQCAFDTGVWAN